MGGRERVSGKRSAKVSVNVRLLDEAPRLNVSLPQPREDSLPRLIREEEARAWLSQNRKALEAYNARIERDGVWSDKLRGY